MAVFQKPLSPGGNIYWAQGEPDAWWICYGTKEAAEKADKEYIERIEHKKKLGTYDPLQPTTVSLSGGRV